MNFKCKMNVIKFKMSFNLLPKFEFESPFCEFEI